MYRYEDPEEFKARYVRNLFRKMQRGSRGHITSHLRPDEINTHEDKEMYREMTGSGDGVFNFAGYMEDGMFARAKERDDDNDNPRLPGMGLPSSKYD